MKIGVYICECGVNISATVDVEKVAEHICVLIQGRILLKRILKS